MCFRDFIRRLAGEGIRVSDTQVRWAITTGKLPRPPLDGSLRYVFGDEHLEIAKRIFSKHQVAVAQAASNRQASRRQTLAIADA
jgi:hypothetical protein